MGNVFSLNVTKKIAEKDYAHILNCLLPKEIWVISHLDVEKTFNARFNCKRRAYKYFFRKGKYNINEMKNCLKDFLGIHDFRNFCKIDVVSTKDFKFKLLLKTRREIYDVKIEEIGNGNTIIHDENKLYYFYIEANSFIWHMVFLYLRE